MGSALRALKRTRVYGTVDVSIGSDGRLLEISDGRILCEFVGNEPLTTLDEALDTSLEIGVGRWDGPATVEEARLGYSLMEESSYLVPVWVLDGHLQSQNGEQVDWVPEILALT